MLIANRTEQIRSHCPQPVSTLQRTPCCSEDIRHAPRFTWTPAFFAILLTAITVACGDAVTPTSPETTTTTTTTQSPPTVTDISPTSGSNDGGTTVTITGTGFTNISSVAFGGTAVNYTIVSDTSITATTPAAAAGVVDVVVTTTGGSSAVSEADQFEFAVNTLTDLSFSSSAVAAGLPMRGSVSLTFPAPSTGIRIPLTWNVSPSGSSAVLYPLAATIPAGAMSGSFQVTTFFVSSPVTAQVSAEHGGETRSASFVIAP